MWNGVGPWGKLESSQQRSVFLNSKFNLITDIKFRDLEVRWAHPSTMILRLGLNPKVPVTGLLCKQHALE